MAYVAFNELTTGAGVTVFVGMVASFLTLVLLTKRPLGVSLLACLLLGTISLLNAVKYSYLREMIHPIDFYLLLSWIGNDLSFLGAYWKVVGFGALGLAAVVLGSAVLWVFEGWVLRRFLRTPNLMQPALVFAALAAIYWAAFSSGSYLSSAVALSFYSQLTINTGPRLSYLQMALEQMQRIRSELSALSDDAGRGIDESGKGGTDTVEVCKGCPDLIVYHVESVFDPNMMEPYAGSGSLSEHLRGPLASEFGSLRTNVFGGRSMISEFELLCGVHHGLFGVAGTYPNLFLQPFIQRCGPRQLRRLGYETTAFYTTPATVNHSGDMFRAYGIETFVDSEALGLPPQWHAMRDKHLVDAALEILSRPRVRPRLIFISAMFNHGPHGSHRLTERYSGPYDIERAENPAVMDYMNRLNDTIGQIQRLDKAVADLPHRAAVLYYGDHQPSIPAEFSSHSREQFGEDLKFITFYRIAANWPILGGSMRHDARAMPIENLFGHFTDAVGMGDLTTMKKISEFSNRECGGSQLTCPEEKRKTLRSFILN
jgi:phosphoglycerol transferase MdoB-like AlkP superfamily enzyme